MLTLKASDPHAWLLLYLYLQLYWISPSSDTKLDLCSLNKIRRRNRSSKTIQKGVLRKVFLLSPSRSSSESSSSSSFDLVDSYLLPTLSISTGRCTSSSSRAGSLSIVVGIESPLSTHGIFCSIVALQSPSGKTLQRVCLLNRTSPKDLKPDPRYQEVIARMIQNPYRRQPVRDNWARQRIFDLGLHLMELGSTSDIPFNEWFWNKYGQVSQNKQLNKELSETIASEIPIDRARFLSDLVFDDQLGSIIVGYKSISSGVGVPSFLEEGRIPPVDLLVVCSDSTDEGRLEDASPNLESFRWFTETVPTALQTRRVRLVGFSVKWAEDLGRDFGKRGDSRRWEEERQDGSRRREIYVPALPVGAGRR